MTKSPDETAGEKYLRAEVANGAMGGAEGLAAAHAWRNARGPAAWRTSMAWKRVAREILN